MKLIVGLGNPGEKYEKTRHNVGFILLSLLAEKMEINFEFNSNFNAEIAEIKTEKEKLLLCKPQTFMNNSGQAVSKVMNYYKIDSNDLLVIQDEMDLPFGKIRFSNNSSSAGHKGIKSIIDYLGTQEFRRLRFGVKHENNQLPTEIFVLKNFTKEELETTRNFDTEKIFTIFDNV
jgi:PTH1 family peptidyl-tRNA hydrolase